MEIKLLTTLRYLTVPEAISFVPAGLAELSPPSASERGADGDDALLGGASPRSPWDLVIGLRDSCTLVYVPCGEADSSTAARSVSLNERAWDTHASFTPLLLVPSPNEGRLLLVATDKNYHLLFQTGTNRRLRLFADHSCGQYGRPKACWDHTGKYIFCNSELESCIYVYSVAAEKAVRKLTHHTGSVRDLAYFTTTAASAATTSEGETQTGAVDGSETPCALLVSGSFDKSVVLWSFRPDTSNS